MHWKSNFDFIFSRNLLLKHIVCDSFRYSGVWLITRCGSLMKSGYDLHDWGLCLFILMSYGVVFRVIAFFCMVTFRKKWADVVIYTNVQKGNGKIFWGDVTASFPFLQTRPAYISVCRPKIISFWWHLLQMLRWVLQEDSLWWSN